MNGVDGTQAALRPAVQYPADLSEWDGFCLELVDRLLHEHPDGDILHVELSSGPWTWHAALVLDGIVYDAWHPEVHLPPAEYVEHVFGSAAISWELNPGSEPDEQRTAHPSRSDDRP